MIRDTKQSWEVGAEVRVGFMVLTVLAAIPTPGDYAPDAYVLQSAKGKLYRFTPHHGIEACATMADASRVSL